MKQIAQSDLDHWYRHGFVVIPDLLDAEELTSTRRDFYRYMPDWPEYASRQPLYSSLAASAPQAAQGWVRHEFPYQGDAVNSVAVHPFLVAFAEALLGRRSIALSHGAIVGKYAGKADYDQELHGDFSNNTLVYPRDEPEYSDIPMIVYHTDVTLDLGPTYVVSKELTRDLPPRPGRFYPRSEYPLLYEAEQPATVSAGSVLIYSMTTLHRGSAMRATEGIRFSQFVAFHAAGVPWLGSASFQGYGGQPEMNEFLVKASPRERELVGFPPVGDPYWNQTSLDGVAVRYPAMDMHPYRSAAVH